MKIKVIAFTAKGAELCKSIEGYLEKCGHEAVGYTMKKYADGNNLLYLENGLASWTEEGFSKEDALIYIGASGIAVRSIAPFIKDKATDSAVIVIDDNGKFVISLLSGHLGGANELTNTIADYIRGIPVVTTATDVNSKLSVDVWAKKNNLHIGDMKAAKYVAAALLDESNVGLKCDFEVMKPLADHIVLKDKGDIGINIALNDDEKPFKTTLNLIPKIVSIGVGCRKNTSFEDIEDAIFTVLNSKNISIEAIKNMVSIDLKKNEEGIIAFAKKYNLDFKTYPAEVLGNATGDFTPSKFVSSITGVDNVCERSAKIGSNNGEIIVRKTVKNSVTVALGLEEWKCKFN